jgi:hypothetical protein
MISKTEDSYRKARFAPDFGAGEVRADALFRRTFIEL